MYVYIAARLGCSTIAVGLFSGLIGYRPNFVYTTKWKMLGKSKVQARIKFNLDSLQSFMCNTETTGNDPY
jgi:hypothetical protein